MNINKPLATYGAVDITGLREKMLQLPADFWDIDHASRIKLAGTRPGNAVYFYNDKPPCINRPPLAEAKSGRINVLRYKDRPLFNEILALIQSKIEPIFPDCDIMRVQLAELPPGQVITPHRDTAILELIHRLHVPIVTHRNVKFIIDGHNFFLEEGVLYDLNNTVIHSVENNSDVMRIHLLVDMIPHSLARAFYHDTEDEMKSACKKQ